MAAADEKTLCSTCGKGNGRIRCEGCSKIFCLKDFNGHQQELGKQVEEIEVTRDLFRQTLTEKLSEPQKHALIEQIDEWENESINQIRQAAKQARRILLQHTAELNTKIENKLNKLTNEIRQSREENDFFEPKISHWREELTQMENELAKPSSVTMRKDPTPLVTKINVDISDERHHNKFCESNRITMTCPYCHQDCEISERDKHFENCFRNPLNTAKRQQPQHNPISSQNSDRLNYVDEPKDADEIPCEACNKTIKWCDYSNHMQLCATQLYPQIQESQYAYTMDEPNNARCRYCDKKYMNANLEMHEKNCKRNPVNIDLDKQFKSVFSLPLPDKKFF